MLRSIREALDLREDGRLSPHATRNAAALRRTREEALDEGYRQAFSVDVDRILYSRAYARYIDKTQVFYLIRNDHITHRVLHVQLVSKIGRTIGRFLGLNEDLIEAIALGHDIGHTPFGHDGERFLSELCVEHGIGELPPQRPERALPRHGGAQGPGLEPLPPDAGRDPLPRRRGAQPGPRAPPRQELRDAGSSDAGQGARPCDRADADDARGLRRAHGRHGRLHRPRHRGRDPPGVDRPGGAAGGVHAAARAPATGPSSSTW